LSGATASDVEPRSRCCAQDDVVAVALHVLLHDDGVGAARHRRAGEDADGRARRKRDCSRVPCRHAVSDPKAPGPRPGKVGRAHGETVHRRVVEGRQIRAGLGRLRQDAAERIVEAERLDLPDRRGGRKGAQARRIDGDRRAGLASGAVVGCEHYPLGGLRLSTDDHCRVSTRGQSCK
jgi:hypothetical protein